MTEPSDKESKSLKTSTAGDLALDAAATLSAIAPWVGGPVSVVLSGISLQRKFARVKHVLDTMAAELEGFKSSASEDYVQTEDFQELLEHGLKAAADERSELKRQIYGRFLADLAKSPGKPYDEELRFLKLLEELQPDHLRVLKALSDPPGSGHGTMGSPIQTLTERLPELPRGMISQLVEQLNDLRVTKIDSLVVISSVRTLIE